MKTLCLSTLIVFCSFFAQAQKVKPGFKGGLNAASLSNLPGDNRLSGHIGLLLHVSTARQWAFQPEILYSGAGQQYFMGGKEYTWALNYIAIPMMFQYYPVKRFYLEFGPQLGLLAAARVKGPNGYNVDAKEGVHKADATLNFGAGFFFTRQVGAYMRYGLGLTDVSAHDNYSYCNRVLQLGVELRLH